jgi:hypothetical protein
MHSKDLAAFRRESERLGVQHTAQLKSIEAALKELVRRRDGSLSVRSPGTELSALQDMMAHVSLSERNVARELAIISSLGFESRTVRHSAISPAHKETFQWVFETRTDPTQEQAATSNTLFSGDKQPKLLKWLKHGGGAFWVSGKPGSGKSTFMKFIADHPATRSALSHWAHPLPVVIASHYFWGSGTEMQKSLQGLLQTLLYDIFRHCPDLIRVTCPSRWEAEQQEHERQQPWTLPELRTVLEAISAQSGIARKFCFFIDGLDEFDGEHLDFCDSLMAMMDSPNIKLCVSSRPWNVFEDAFGQDMERKIYIHELTRPDIIRYARDRLYQHPRWRLLGLPPARASLLIESIADKAQGVFLWVTIVTRLLREGLTNDDTPADLRRRLESFPSDLEPFFKQIVESVPGFYRVKMAEALRIALAAHEPLDAMIYSFHDDAERQDSGDDGEFAPEQPLGWECNAEAMEARREQVARRLNGRCRGLLELNFMGKIDFLHRTVTDFLRTREMSDFLRANTPPNFGPNLAILKAYTAWVKTAGPEDNHFSLEPVSGDGTSHLRTQLAYNIKQALGYAADAELETTVPIPSVDAAIDEMDYAVSSLVSSLPPFSRHGPRVDLRMNLSRLFRELVLGVPLMAYLSRKVPSDPTYFFDFNLPALTVVLHHPDPPPTKWPVQAAEKLKRLLQNGHNPNQHLPGTGMTIWTDFCSNNMLEAFSWMSYENIALGPRFLAALEERIFILFLEHGADPNAALAPLSSPFERLAVLAFDIPADSNNNNNTSHTRHETNYISALDSFISYGAKLTPYCNTDASTGGTAAPLFLTSGPTRVHPCTQFFRRLRDDAKNHSSPGRARFRVEVLRRVLPLAQQALWPLAAHRTVLDEVLSSPSSAHGFGTEGSEGAAGADESKVNGGGGIPLAGKRRLEDDGEGRRVRLCYGPEGWGPVK